MAALPIRDIGAEHAPAAAYGAAVLHALAREEQAERRPRRLLEPDQATWARFRGRLGARDFLELLLEDAAVTQPHPFHAATVLPAPAALGSLPHDLVAGWIAALPTLDLAAPSADYIATQAKQLGVTVRGAKADLHRVKPHHKILEAPGSGGQLALHMIQTRPELHLRDSFTIACCGWAEATLAGLVAVELATSGDLPITVDPDLGELRKRSFDYVVGLTPDKGGRHDALALRRLFPGAEVVLV
jgi:hypothetical protein